jgi:hypothetical protein
MNLCGEFITHKAFGRGQIVDLENHCVTVIFQDTNEKKRFIYPEAFGKYLTLENKTLVRQVQEYQNEIAQRIATAQAEIENMKLPEKKVDAKKPAKKAPRKKTI